MPDLSEVAFQKDKNLKFPQGCSFPTSLNCGATKKRALVISLVTRRE